MKISMNDNEIFAFTDIQKQVIKNEVPSEVFDEDIERRLKYVLMHKYEQCFKRLKEKWDRKLIDNGVKSVPTDPDEYAQLVFSQPNYKNRSARDAEQAGAQGDE